MSKINCTSPHHDDQTASMEVYEDGGFCFACGWVDKGVQDYENKRPEPTDIPKALEVIRERCEIRNIRGLQLPCDSKGYYIVWPTNDFYKTRTWSGSPRYLGPRGHKSPIFIYRTPGAKNLVLVEGELNAMSLKLALGDVPFDIASPGSATNFDTYYNNTILYDTICVIVDKDPAGVSAGIDLKRKLLKCQKKVVLHAVEKDLNDILQDSGPEGLKKAFYDLLGVSRRLSPDEDTMRTPRSPTAES